MDHCHIIIAWDLTFSATKEDLAQPGWIYFALNLKIHLFFFSLYQMGENRLLRWMLTVSAETTHLSLSSWKTFLNAHQWIMCQRATGGQSSWSNRRGLQRWQRGTTVLFLDNFTQQLACWQLGKCFLYETLSTSQVPYNSQAYGCTTQKKKGAQLKCCWCKWKTKIKSHNCAQKAVLN